MGSTITWALGNIIQEKTRWEQAWRCSCCSGRDCGCGVTSCFRPCLDFPGMVTITRKCETEYSSHTYKLLFGQYLAEYQNETWVVAEVTGPMQGVVYSKAGDTSWRIRKERTLAELGPGQSPQCLLLTTYFPPSRPHLRIPPFPAPASPVREQSLGGAFFTTESPVVWQPTVFSSNRNC